MTLSIRLVLVTLFATLMSASMSKALRPFAPVCDMEVRQVGTTIQWRCTTGACSQCGVTGSCETKDVIGDVSTHACRCEDDEGASARDTCSVFIIQTSTSLTVECINGPEDCECMDGFYMGPTQVPRCVPLPASLPEDFAFVCTCIGGSEGSDN